MHFAILDWSILTIYLILVFYVGVWGKKYIRDTSDFLVAGRGMGRMSA